MGLLIILSYAMTVMKLIFSCNSMPRSVFFLYHTNLSLTKTYFITSYIFPLIIAFNVLEQGPVLTYVRAAMKNCSITSFFIFDINKPKNRVFHMVRSSVLKMSENLKIKCAALSRHEFKTWAAKSLWGGLSVAAYTHMQTYSIYRTYIQINW